MHAVYVCVCNGVTDRDIQRAVEEGCDSLEALSARTGCGSTCGCCRDYAAEALAQAMTPARALGLPIAA
jgi:bacterioferritin-associated ferredoxin